jgi:polysaccharide export outer membrane protein
MRAWAVTALVAGAFFGAGGASANAQASDSLRLRAGDGVRVEITDEPTLSGEFVIGADGQIMLPTIGAVPVAARSFQEVERDLMNAYRRELVDPTVRLTPLVRVAVLGEVRQPGLLLIDPTHTVSDVLARAGGLSTSANPKKIMIQRATGVVSATFELGSPPLGLRLGSGDQILVDRRSAAHDYVGILVGAAASIGAAVLTSALLRR